MNKQDYTKATVDVPFHNKHIRFENLTSEQVSYLMQISEFYQLSGVRRSAVIPQEETLEEAAERKWGNVRTATLGFIEGAKWQAEQFKYYLQKLNELCGNK